MSAMGLTVYLAMHEGDRDRAWRSIQLMTVEELDEFEDALDALQDLVDARHAADVLLNVGDVKRCICPVDPDDEDDPGDVISTCPIHGWVKQ